MFYINFFPKSQVSLEIGSQFPGLWHGNWGQFSGRNSIKTEYDNIGLLTHAMSMVFSPSAN